MSERPAHNPRGYYYCRSCDGKAWDPPEGEESSCECGAVRLRVGEVGDVVMHKGARPMRVNVPTGGDAK